MYIKRTNTTKLPEYIPLGYKQVFKDRTSETQTVSKQKIAERVNKGFITDEDIEIVKFIFKFGSVSLEEVYRFMYLINKGSDDISFAKAEKKLSALVNYKILHKYILADNSDEIIRDDAFTLYCLNAGGAYILKNYSNSEDDAINWAMHKEIKDTSKIIKGLSAAEFFLDLYETCPEKLEFFQFKPELKNGITKVVPTFVFGLNKNGKGSDVSYFVGEVFNDSEGGLLDGAKDSLSQFATKLRRLEEVFKTNWNKTYGDATDMTAPMLLIIGNPGQGSVTELLTRLSRTVTSTDIDKFRLTTLENINHKDLSEGGVLLKYKEQEDKLVKIRVSNFKPLEPKE